MDVNKLAMMAVQIEKHTPDYGDAVDKIATHLIKFWTPAMRSSFYAEVVANRSNYSETLNGVVDEMRNRSKA